MVSDVLKKDPDIDQSALSNREKAVIIDVLKNRYSLPLLLQKLQLSKSSYYYQEQSLQKEDNPSSKKEIVTLISFFE